MALAACLFACSPAAQLENYASVCGSPDASAQEVVRMCQKALDTGQLSPTASAQVRANLGTAELYEHDHPHLRPEIERFVAT